MKLPVKNILQQVLLSSSKWPVIGESPLGNGYAGAVASESKICSEIGVELIEMGGNAADAMVGTTLCVGVIGMYHSGIGGGGFMLVQGPDGEYEAIDFRETAPAAAYEDMFQGNIIGSVIGGLSAAVPGDLAGLEYLHNKYGALPWKTVVNPAVHVARHGFPVTEDTVRYMSAATSNGNNFLVDDPSWAIDFAPNGTLVKLHDILTRKRYADTLEKIGVYGARVFYEGEIANATIAAVQATNGTMTLSDLQDYKVITRPPISIDYRGYKVHSVGAPSGGAVGLSILKIIEGYEMSNRSISHLNLHRLDEAMRFAYGAHNELGDPDFFSYMESYVEAMISESSAAGIRGKILDDRTQNVSVYDPKGYAVNENHGTTHVVASDSSGLSITSTTTINLLFGAQLMVPETGVILNNEMNDFSIPGVSNAFGFVPSPINYIRPLKRPLSSITPIIVTHPNGTLYLNIGAAGGSRIITSTIQAIWHVLDHNLTLPEALKEPRFHDQLLPDRTGFEAEFDKDAIRSMRDRGHNITYEPYLTAVQGIRRLADGTFEPASEPRQKSSGGLTA
ncbi:gamma-glutamyltranspeptidase [Phlyctema vagabunda]|uniref:Glutathione hydrolase n=1 Tax=Phlyctema vagabunda TaxID=108571 RepID=A0ABR4PB36_9HELO